MHGVRSWSFLGLGLAFTLTACRDDNTGPSGNDPNLNADIATSVGFAVAQDAALLTNPGFFDGNVGAGDEFRASNCTFISASGRFECPAQEWEDMNLTRSYRFLDASGNALTVYDPLLIRSFNVRSSLTGTAHLGKWDGTINWERDFTATGLGPASTRWTWNGTGTATIHTSRHTNGGTTRTYNIATTTQVNDVVVPYPLTGTIWPTSGTIVRNVTVTYLSGEFEGETVTRTVTVTFNGTQTARLTVGSLLFDLNLRTGAVVQVT